MYRNKATVYKWGLIVTGVVGVKLGKGAKTICEVVFGTDGFIN